MSDFSYSQNEKMRPPSFAGRGRWDSPSDSQEPPPAHQPPPREKRKPYETSDSTDEPEKKKMGFGMTMNKSTMPFLTKPILPLPKISMNLGAVDLTKKPMGPIKMALGTNVSINIMFIHYMYNIA